MSKRIPIILAVLATLLSAPVVATANPAKQYVLKHPKHERCEARYVKKAETVKKRERGRAVKIRETLCIYVTSKSAPIKSTTPAATVPAPTPSTPTLPAPSLTTPTPTISAPARTVTLHVHLDPSFVQSPTNPLAVTYHYSASATVGSENEPSLPSGVLNLYSDGLLACSINVGDSVTGGECPVTYLATGRHTVIVTYSSGSTSVTETVTETIEPFSTHTSLGYTSECGEVFVGQNGEYRTTWCEYIMTPVVTNQYGGTVNDEKVVITVSPPTADSQDRQITFNAKTGHSFAVTLELKEAGGCLLVINGVPNQDLYQAFCSGPSIAASFAGNEGWLSAESDSIPLEA